jgi:hypothetical protein
MERLPVPYLSGRGTMKRRSVATLVLLVLVLAACSSDPVATTSETVSGNAEVEQVLADYRAAWTEADADAFLDVVTDDFTIAESVYLQIGDEFDITSFKTGRDATATKIEGNAWQIEHVGEPLTVGEGPWFVSIGENWTGGNDRWVYNGTGTYGIIDQGGTLKIATVHWSGQQRRPDDYTPGS